jgi:uncharacterized protein (DUF1697 family)
MDRYVALLRGINVGGRNLIKMDQLSKVFASSGFKNVRTLIASGNVSFDAPQGEPQALARKIERKLQKKYAREFTVVVRTIEDLKTLVKRNPFKQAKTSKDAMLFVTFLSSTPSEAPKLLSGSEKERLEVVSVRDGVIFMVARRKKNGWFTFPNDYVEKVLGVSATTRNWTTVQKLAAAKPD